ncbi:UPF0149 family protein [Sphingomonas sp. XXL09]|uniref:UPF0149 family protein n=1 Tax=Sphingomonas sp. XXL09 TaxID=3457787 RepID=UPI00406BBEC2
MRALPSRFRRLDGALADLPVEEPMLLTELDGFLTGLSVLPAAIPAMEWMAVIWGPETDGIPAFDDPLDVQWFAGAVAARRDEIVRDLARGRLQPIIDVDERDGEPLWDDWIHGFAEAIALRPELWETMADQPRTATAVAGLETLIAVAREESELDSVAINALQEHAVAELKAAVQVLHAALPQAAAQSATAAPAAKVGRNDPCPCGSGRKHKRCCG